MHHETDTIVAPITAPGRGAIAVVRLSGSKAVGIAREVFPSLPEKLEYRFAYYGDFVHGDDGLITVFAESASYTGEESVEMSIHGSPASVQSLVESCITYGARLAEPGEFTLRAFMNGRIDLSQAEGVRETIESVSLRQLEYANSMRSGEINKEISLIREELLAVLAAVEAQTDFSEEVGPLDIESCNAHLNSAISKMDQLLATQNAARVVRQGVRVALAGLPNAGKSSLLNALLKQDRAIVTEIPGTTRDTIEESVEISGILVRLTDTAGVRDTSDPLEQLGVERSRVALRQAELILYLYDASKGITEEDEKLLALLDRPVVRIGTKIDLGFPPVGEDLGISIKTGAGLSDLVSAIENHIAVDNEAIFLLDRHYELLKPSKKAVEACLITLNSVDTPSDLAAVELQQGIRLLGEITGETTPPDVIEQIFSRFCIGK
ncbi:tRNA uridine-5-carboxymethylaminomethyl(34) synthesis GTPase MnmE [Kamptonema cortianum]|nr:tRNA uridine-5-carboxymethylaminomethyl(34) synthesis GTPase MnmE [Geitlerinema splendidum]MDK3157557.1 tRNA uridine-5-carboxymethylaminomethyl(34) synthesis GTPase MnmE [Kamptonema cortianum]